MIFNTLKINNFLSVGEAEVCLNNQGLVLIEGRNLDDPSAKSNGAGKSSIVDALCWVLYGKTARGVATDAVVNRHAKKDCGVSVEVIDGDQTYVISRYRKDKEHGNGVYVTCGDKDFTKGTSAETQALIEKIIGCPHQVFVATVHAGQDAMPDLPAMTDKQLKELIESVIGMERLTVAYQKAQKRRLEQEQKYRLAEERAHNVGSSLDMAKSLSERIRSDIARNEANEKQRIADKEAEIKEIQEKLLKAKAENVVSEKQIAECNAELEKIKAELNSIEQTTQKLKVFSKTYDDAQSEVVIAAAGVRYAKQRCESIADDIRNLDAKVGTKCSECGKTYKKEDLNDAKIALMNSLKSEVEDCKVASNRLQEVQAVADKAKKEYESFKECVPDASALTHRWGEINRDLEVLRSSALHVASLERSLEEHTRLLEDLKSGKNNPLLNSLDECTRREFDLAELNTVVRQDLSKEKYKFDLLCNVEKVLGPTGIRQHVLDSITPILNERTARYLNVLSDGKLSAVWTTLTQTKKGEIKEKFNIAVSNSVGGDSFDSLSGGEKRKVRVACCLALQELVSSRATKPIEIFIADEVDHALDEAGVERLIGVLNEKAQVCKTLLVISHNPLRNWIDNTITVIKEDGKTRLSQ